MTSEQNKVKEFMVAAQQPFPTKPSVPDEQIRVLRVRLLLEEVFELAQASAVGIYCTVTNPQFKKALLLDDILLGVQEGGADLVGVADALGDIKYVGEGAAVAWGIDLEPIFNEIHASNMTKFIDGHRREDGKWIKGPSYRPADLKPIVEAQQVEAQQVEAQQVEAQQVEVQQA